MIGLIAGRSVHYVEEDGTSRAAVIVKVHSEAPIVNLFCPPRMAEEQGVVVENVRFSRQEKVDDPSKPNTWHWIPRVE